MGHEEFSVAMKDLYRAIGNHINFFADQRVLF